MKRALLFISLIFLSTNLLAQGVITGKVIDKETGEGLISATVRIDGSTKGAITDFNGDFTITNVSPGTVDIIISYVSFEDMTKTVEVKNGETANIGTVEMVSSAIGLQAVNIVASTAIDRKTPVAVSTIKAEEIENKLGNQEFPEIMKSTPSVYTYNEGGGAGDAQMFIRGFSQENFAVLINGISVSGMEDNKVYWSNWAGLGDVTRTIQVQRGLGASRLAITSVGGTVNIVTKTTDQRKGGSVFTGIGNNGYKKTGLTLSTGRTDNGWALTFSGSRTTGDGFIEGNYIDAWSYFGSIAKEIDDSQQLMFTIFGAPQKHGQRSFWQPIDDQKYKYGTRWSDDYGFYQGNPYTFRENFYHKPQASLTHIWDVGEKTDLITSVYGSVGRGGGTGDIGTVREFLLEKSPYGRNQFDEIAKYNSGDTTTTLNMVWGAPIEQFSDYDYEDADGNSGSGRVLSASDGGIIKRASMNEHQWWGVLSTLTQDLNENLTLNGGIDFRFYTGSHYRKPIDLLGGEYYFDDDNVNDTDDWVDFNADGVMDANEMGNLLRPLNDASKLFGSVEDGERIDYHNDENINWFGLFGQLEYSKESLSAFVSGALNNTQMRRIDFFNKEPGAAPGGDLISQNGRDNQTTDWLSYTGGNVKVGANYNLDEFNNVFVNAGFISRAPYFDALFPTFNNDEANVDAPNESILSFEAGYGYRSTAFSANLNAYYTQWQDKTETNDFQDPNTGDIIYFNLLGVDATHSGVEVDFAAKVNHKLTVRGFGSLGDWTWANDPKGFVSDDSNNVIDTLQLYTKDLKVGGSAQTTFGFGADWNLGSGVFVDAQWNAFENLYASFFPSDRDDIGLSGVQALKLPFYSLLDAGITWKFEIAGMDASARVNVNNVLDEQYISYAEDNPDPDLGDEREGDLYNELIDDTRGWFGFGRTWNTTFKIYF